MTVKTGVDSQTLVNQINTDIANAHTSVYSVSSQAQMLALTAQKGDIAVRTDTNYNYILSDLPASTLSNWVELKQDKDLLPSVPYSMHIAGGSTAVSSITLVGEPCYDVNAILVLVSHTIVPPSSYSLNATGTVLTFTSPVEAGLDIDLRWYSQLVVSPSNQFANSDLSNLSSIGKSYVAIKGYDNATPYSLNDVVLSIVSGKVKLYKSLADNNTSSLTDTTKWEEVENDLSNYVTLNTAQSISAKKTFLGEKAVLFKQNATTDKLGFTLYNTASTELGAFEWRPNTINGGALLNVNAPYTSVNYVGFRYCGTSVNVIAPKVETAGNYFIPVNFTDGSTTVSADNKGTVNLSSILPNSAVWGNITGTLSNQTDLKAALDEKQPSLVSGTNIKTVNNESLLGSGNLNIQSGPTYTAGTGIDITNNVISSVALVITDYTAE